jgi:hypothetical protein
LNVAGCAGLVVAAQLAQIWSRAFTQCWSL